MKKLLSFIILASLLLSLCACGTAEESPAPSDDAPIADTAETDVPVDEWILVDSTSAFTDVFKKDLWPQLDSTFSYSIFSQPARVMAEMRATNDAGIIYIFRMAKADSWQEITSDMDITWAALADDHTDLMPGKKGEGTLRLDWPRGEMLEYPFTGGIWYDEVDGLCYALVCAGEGAPWLDPDAVFTPEATYDLSTIASYEEAKTFHDTHLHPGRNIVLYLPDDGTGYQTYVESVGDGERINLYWGTETNYQFRSFYSDGTESSETLVTAEDGSAVASAVYREGTYSEYLYSTSGKLTESFGYYADGTMLSHSIYDENENPTYSYWVPTGYYSQEVWPNENRMVKHRFSDDYSTEYTYTVKTVDGYERRYFLTSSSPVRSTVFTYVSADSPILSRFESTNHQTGEHALWILDGTGNEAENVVELHRTVGGVTTVLTPGNIPWGSNMEYMPKLPEEFYF